MSSAAVSLKKGYAHAASGPAAKPANNWPDWMAGMNSTTYTPPSLYNGWLEPRK